MSYANQTVISTFFKFYLSKTSHLPEILEEKMWKQDNEGYWDVIMEVVYGKEIRIEEENQY